METSTVEVAVEDRESPPASVASGPLYSRNAIVGTTAFGGLIAGSLLLMANFRRLGRPELAPVTVAASVLFMIAFMWILVVFPEHWIDVIPDVAFAAIWTGLGLFLVEKYQQSDIAAHFEGGGQKASAWGAIGATVAGGVATVVIVVVLIASMPFISITDDLLVTEEAPGPVHFADAEWVEEANLVGSLLDLIQYWEGDPTRAAVLLSGEAGFELTLDVDAVFWDDRPLLNFVEALIMDLEDLWNEPVTVVLANGIAQDARVKPFTREDF